MPARMIENRFLSVTVDARGRIVSLRNRVTSTELITHREASEAWRMVVPTGRHTVEFVLGSKQPPPTVAVTRGQGKARLVISYDRLVAPRQARGDPERVEWVGARVLPLEARFILELEDDSKALWAWVEMDNRSRLSVDEVEFPVVGGLGGWWGRHSCLPSGQARMPVPPGSHHEYVMNLVAGSDRGRFFGDVLNRGLPDTGRESNHFVREHETAMFEAQNWWAATGGVWLDLYTGTEGLYVGCHSARAGEFALKVERFPKGVPNAPAHFYPKGTPRWLRVGGLFVPRLRPGTRWVSEKVVLMPHAGDWHAGADCYCAFRHERLKPVPTPAWMRDFVGWTEILGKTYLGETFHDFKKCADDVVRDKKVTGIDLLFYYGHTAIGAEGADFDQSPAPDLGGEKGFRRMLAKLRRSGVRVMLLDHLHRWVNRDVPEYKRLKLERFAVLDENGKPRTARWWKETFLSCRRLEGPTPVWVEMCPSCEGWLRHYLAHVTRMIGRGVDGLELDTFTPGRCHNPKHAHPVGAEMMPWKLAFVRCVREHAKRLDPDFVLFGETMAPEGREMLDGFYPDRFPDENGRIYRYLFPEIRELAVLVGNYAYDAVNRAMMLGIGVETEIWGLRKTTLAACPELAQYIGEVNRFRRRHADILIRGTFRDTVGAKVRGDILYGVLEGTRGSKALVLRNPHDHAVKASGTLRGVTGRRLILWQPGRKEKSLGSLPVSLALGPYGAAVVLAM